MAQSEKTCLTSVKEILSKYNHADAKLSDAELIAKLEPGIQINPTQAIWKNLSGQLCLEIFPGELKMGPGEWSYSTIPFKPTPWFPTIDIDVAHLDSSITLFVEGQTYLPANAEALLHFKMDDDASGWQLPVTFILTSPGGEKVSLTTILQEYIGKPGYHLLPIGTFPKKNALGECKVEMITMDRSGNIKKGLTVHGFQFRFPLIYN